MVNGDLFTIPNSLFRLLRWLSIIALKATILLEGEVSLTVHQDH